MGPSIIRVACSAIVFTLLNLPEASSAPLAPDTPDGPSEQASRYLGYLEEVMDQYHRTLDVYTDANSGGNHFLVKAKMGATSGGVAMDEFFDHDCHSGSTCIQCSFRTTGGEHYVPWGGYYFLNGVSHGRSHRPKVNWGTFARAGLDLRGATNISFWARGERGGERVKFFALGVGWDFERASPEFAVQFPDSAYKVSRVVSLTTSWKQFRLSVRPVALRQALRPFHNLLGYGTLHADLRYVLGGFGWVTEEGWGSPPRREKPEDLRGWFPLAGPPPPPERIQFYLDDIQYDLPRLAEPRFLASFSTEWGRSEADKILSNAAFTYDNALAILAFVAMDKVERARLVGDALLYAQHHDPEYSDGRLRNAYMAGDLRQPPGWNPNHKEQPVRLPGWYDPKARKWLEDEFAVSTHTGNLTWAILALVVLHEATGDQKYLASAAELGEWIEQRCRSNDGPGGYSAGIEGFRTHQVQLTYKATEHNIDLFVAFSRLASATGDERWSARAAHARGFVESMWNEESGCFLTGTNADGQTPSREVVPLDAQSWALLAFEEWRDVHASQYRALQCAETRHAIGNGGFDFNTDRDGVWYEGTGQMAVLQGLVGEVAARDRARDLIARSVAASGGVPAADRDGLTTGFALLSGEPWLYYARPHVGATAWAIFAELKVNPFWLLRR